MGTEIPANVLMHFTSDGKLISISDKDLISYDIASNTYKRKAFNVKSPSKISVNPDNENLVAVMSQASMTIFVFDLNSE